jgi:phosphotransferase system enzyme I (PtsI)
MILRGHGVSPGVFEGRARVLDARAWIGAAAAVPAPGDPAGELERLRAARARASAQLTRVQRQLSGQGRQQDAEIFGAHAMMLRDPVLLQRMEHGILENALSAEASVARATVAVHTEFETSPVPMVRDKAGDVLDVGHRLLGCLDPRLETQTARGEPTVLVAATLTPSELVRVAHRGPCAALTESCGVKSHTAILARSLGVPLVTGIADLIARVPEGASILLDAEAGVALVDADGSELEAADAIRAALVQTQRDQPRPRQPVTRDGVAIQVALNVSDPREAELVTQLGAAGVGLFRTEFFYLDRQTWPTEDEILAIYRGVAAAVGDGQLYIRLSDFGADKCPSYADFPMGRNPSLGLRGVRLLLQRSDILGPQVRAAARLAERRPVSLLIPMLDSLDTLAQLTARLEELCGTRRSGFPFGLGAMIETPAAALTSAELLEEVDLVAIGLNDLTQYMMAADREEESVEQYHDALQPSILRLVSQVISAGSAQAKPVSVCGELAGDPALLLALLTLGVRRFSVSRPDYIRVVELAERLAISELEKRREDLLRARTARQVRGILEAMSPGGGAG